MESNLGYYSDEEEAAEDMLRKMKRGHPAIIQIFKKKEKRQNPYEKTFISHCKDELNCFFTGLSQVHKNAVYLKNGDLHTGYKSKPDWLQEIKAVDALALTEDACVFISHKYTGEDPGGGQDNNKNDGIKILKEASARPAIKDNLKRKVISVDSSEIKLQSLRKKKAVFALVIDGPYYTRKEYQKIRNEFCDRENQWAVNTTGLIRKIRKWQKKSS